MTLPKMCCAARVPVEKKSGNITEAFSISFQKVTSTSKGANLVISWDDVLVQLPIGW